MAAKTKTTTTAIFIISLFLFSTFSTACETCGQAPPPPPKKSPPPATPSCPPPPKTKTPPSTKTPPAVKTPPSAKTPPAVKTPPPVKTPPSASPPSKSPSCPRDILKLGACTKLLGGIVGIIIGTPTSSNCCTLLSGLADLEAAVCLCTAIKANVLGLNLNIPVTLELIISACQKNIPPGFQCK